MVDVTLTDIESLLAGVDVMSEEEIAEWEAVTERWFRNYYLQSRSTGIRRREGREIETEIKFVRQEVTYDANGVPTNTIIYNQRLVYEDPLDDEDASSTSDPLNGGDSSNLNPEELASLPFKDFSANTDLALELRDTVDALEKVKIPLGVPDVPKLETSDTDDGLSVAIIAAIVAAGALILAVLALYLSRRRLVRNKQSEHRGSVLYDG